MQAGNLDHEVKIYNITYSADSFGGGQKTESLFDTDWAKIEPLTTVKDSERVMDQVQVVALGLYRFTFRHRTDIQPKMYFVDEEDQRYEVVSEPMYLGRRQFVAFNCERRDND